MERLKKNQFKVEDRLRRGEIRKMLLHRFKVLGFGDKLCYFLGCIGLAYGCLSGD
jgi:hypothetical protein